MREGGPGVRLFAARSIRWPGNRLFRAIAPSRRRLGSLRGLRCPSVPLPRTTGTVVMESWGYLADWQNEVAWV